VLTELGVFENSSLTAKHSADDLAAIEMNGRQALKQREAKVKLLNSYFLHLREGLKCHIDVLTRIYVDNPQHVTCYRR
jgi:hypothetical protein